MAVDQTLHSGCSLGGSPGRLIWAARGCFTLKTAMYELRRPLFVGPWLHAAFLSMPYGGGRQGLLHPTAMTSSSCQEQPPPHSLIRLTEQR